MLHKFQRYTLMIAKTVFYTSKNISVRNINSRNSEWINLCSVGENFSNTKKPTINLLPEQE